MLGLRHITCADRNIGCILLAAVALVLLIVTLAAVDDGYTG
jgi:hypothetical protein